MHQFLYDLAEMKYRMYHELHIFKPQAYTNDECYKRIQYKSKYEQVLDIINMLPNEQSIELLQIEREYFYEAPYVTK